MVVRYCTADALKRHEPVNAFNLVVRLRDEGASLWLS